MSTYKKKKYSDILIVFAVCISLIVCFVAEGFAAADKVKSDCLRLHILACSDSEKDQEVKLKVRDAVLEWGSDIFSGSLSCEEAQTKLIENREEIQAVANEVLRENGFLYEAVLSIEKEFFETRQYGDISLPAGYYTACKIVLGEGNGHNWWCVMFPPMCLKAASDNTYDDVYTVFGKDGGDLVTGKGGYKIRFRIVEIVENFINDIRN